MTVAIGTAVWVVVLVVLLLMRSTLERHHATWWLWVPVAGFGLGLLGLLMVTRRRKRLRSRAGRPPEGVVGS